MERETLEVLRRRRGRPGAGEPRRRMPAARAEGGGAPPGGQERWGIKLKDGVRTHFEARRRPRGRGAKRGRPPAPGAPGRAGGLRAAGAPRARAEAARRPRPSRDEAGPRGGRAGWPRTENRVRRQATIPAKREGQRRGAAPDRGPRTRGAAALDAGTPQRPARTRDANRGPQARASEPTPQAAAEYIPSEARVARCDYFFPSCLVRF